jgi:hypothetical protein
MRRGKDAVAVSSTHGRFFELHHGEVIVGELSAPCTLTLSFGGGAAACTRSVHQPPLYPAGRLTSEGTTTARDPERDDAVWPAAGAKDGSQEGPHRASRAARCGAIEGRAVTGGHSPGLSGRWLGHLCRQLPVVGPQLQCAESTPRRPWFPRAAGGLVVVRLGVKPAGVTSAPSPGSDTQQGG